MSIYSKLDDTLMAMCWPE